MLLCIEKNLTVKKIMLYCFYKKKQNQEDYYEINTATD